MTSGEHVEHVMQRGPSGRRHDADPSRQFRKRFLSLFVKESFLRQFGFELLESQLQRACA